MSKSIKDFKKLLSEFDEAVKELQVDLIGIFRIGKPVPPKERLAKGDLLIFLANSVLSHKEALTKLEQTLEKVKEQRDSFAKANKLNGQNNPEEEPANVG